MKCPKCGSEMDELDGSYHPYIRYCRVCPYGEKVKPDCYYRVGVQTGQCAVCEWFKECPMQGHGEKVKPDEK